MSSPATRRDALAERHHPAPPAPIPPPDPERAPDRDPERDPGRRRSRRDWVVDTACFLVALLAGLVIIDESQASVPVSEEYLAIDFLVGILACLALWWRRRWPVGVALALALPATFSDMSGGAILIGLFTVAVHRPRPVVAAVAAVHVVATMIYLIILRPDPETPLALWIALLLLLLACVVATGMGVRARRQLVESLRQRALAAETEHLLLVEQARQQERAKIAREMHDVLAHRISLLSMHAGALEFRPDAPPAEIAAAAGVVRASAHQALQDLREVIGVLRQDTHAGAAQVPQPTIADLPRLVDESRAAGAHVRLELRVPGIAAVPTVVGRNAYRIVQEGLTNARKHAPGALVEVLVEGGAGFGLTIEVRSRNPVGATAAAAIPGGGTGLIGLVERSTLAGGRLEHGYAPDGDFILEAWLPWPRD